MFGIKGQALDVHIMLTKTLSPTQVVPIQHK